MTTIGIYDNISDYDKFDHDKSIDEVLSEKTKANEKPEDKEVTLTQAQIEEAKLKNSPSAISSRFKDEIATIGPLFNYQVKFDFKTGKQIYQEVNGVEVPVYETDENGNKIIESSAKWDENISADIRRGLEVYDKFASATEDQEVINEKTIVTDSVLIKLAKQILKEAIEANAEDTIIVQYQHFGLVRFFDGQNFFNARLLYKSSVDPLITILKDMAGLKIKLTNSREEQTNGQIVVGKTNFRVAADSNQYGMFLVLRQQSTAFKSLNELELPNNIKSVFRQAIAAKDGLTIIGGPPGSGKTTLMTTGLVEYQTKMQGSINILSLEQPIETPTPGIIQKDIDEDYGVTWDGAISAALREKPQILRVGETSTRPAAQAIVRAANAGIVAMTTLHMQSVIEVFETLKSLGIEESDIKNSLKLVIYLNRVPRLCPNCKKVESIITNANVNNWVKRNLNDSRSGSIAEIAVRNQKGCELCRKNQKNPALFGTLGKISVYEYLIVNRAMLRIYRRYSDQDVYVLKDKLLHPETIDWDDHDSTLSKAQIEQRKEDFAKGLQYYSIERDILAKLKALDIDFETARYLLSQ